MRRVWHATLVSVITAVAFAISANAAQLRMGVAVEPDSIDPHFHNFGGNKSFMANVFEALTTTDPQAHLVPELAVSWRMVDDATWEFKLRPGVHFSDGTPLTADDVAFSIEQVPHEETKLTGFDEYVRPIDSVQVVDEHTVRFHTRSPFPLAPEYLSAVGIVSRKHGEKASPNDYSDGKAAIGTGPYRFVSWSRGDRMMLERNDSYWGKKPAWDKVVVRYIKNPASRVAALLSGDVDLIDQVSVQDIARVKQDARFRLASGLSADVVSFDFDLIDRSSPKITGNDGKPLKVNPFRDQRVREAVSIAIDRDAIRDRLMNGQSAPDDQFMRPGQYGYDSNVPKLAYNPAKAKQLLAEAGYPHGFHLMVSCQNDRFVNDAAICQAVAQMLTRVGIATQPDVMPHAVWVPKANHHEFSLFTSFWTMDTPEPSIMLISTFATPNRARGMGAFNRSEYSDPAFDKLLDSALSTLDRAKREVLLVKATDVVFHDYAEVPLHHQFNVEAMKRQFMHTPRVDGHMLAAEVEPANEAKGN